jgi:tight adherence protein B
MNTQLLIAVVLGVLCVGAVAFFLLAPTSHDKTRKRLSAIESVRPARRSGSPSNENKERDRRRKLTEALSKVEDNSKANKKRKRVSLEREIEQAGLTFSVRQFYLGSLVCAAVFGVVGFISGQQLWVTALLVFIGGLGAPRWYVGFCRKRRQKKFTSEFSNAIDVIVRGVKSGLPVNECLKIIATESPKPVCEEFHMLTEGIRIGLSLEQVLDRMHERMPLQEVSFFSIVLLIQQKTGGNLAEALGNLANVLRGRKLMEAKIKALSAEAKASAMIIGSLPFLVMGAVQLSSPDYLVPLFATPTGNFILIGSGLWMATGILVMRKMIQIKV